MNAPAKTLDGKALEDAIWLLETRALIRAYLEYEHQYEHLADAIDPLQEFAEASGLVAAIGQDRVQELIAKPFARFRAIVAAEIATEAGAEFEPDLPSDYASQLVMRWELDDERDRWKWTGELPPVQQAAVIEKTPYRTPQSTIDAFKYLVSVGDQERLAVWLRNHPNDAASLFKFVKAA
ncbi:hypothetical protein SAMN05216338_104968 [Bradyrhizobium sp. Rc2d]|uniref:hypothetical protein n=1 Tax=Bradyrhizobium sp. Rc2d TaxID=1855321 RepID=UPI0008862F4F|nr:hypothetical protein [Bradyrhizobium sp. Rc2d]SDJ43803.1 hypothetical protein SAMN05216338_104968 [Bradyrhizobium sp. Rc2d]